MSKADEIFIQNCRDILENGVSDEEFAVRPHWEDGTPAHTVKRFAVVNRYDLSEEFPLLTLRRTFYRSAIEEILWIYQKKSNNVKELSTHIWDAWADENGSIGKAYGYQMSVKHKYPQGEMDQVDKAIYDLKNDPASRRILLTMYIPHDLHEMALAPCAYSLTLNVSKGKLNAILNQRSQDMLTASNWNVCQYSALVIMLAKTAGLEAGELVHVIADAHIYDRHIDIVKRLIEKEPYPAPKMNVEDITDFYKFTKNSFTAENYKFHDFTDKIPVAI